MSLVLDRWGQFANSLRLKRSTVSQPWARTSCRFQPTGLPNRSFNHDCYPSLLQDLTALTLEPNPEQPSNSGIVEAEHLVPKFVNESITNVTKDLAGIGQAPTIVQNTSSQAGNLQFVSDTVDTFFTLLTPLKAFNSVVHEIANVHPCAKVTLSIFTCASKMLLDQADRDVAVFLLLSTIFEAYT
ncbi:hypothetical protein CY34DRAFT_18944 [Suillus luteus UH-Slu-Lm8-n1]|uniref:Uncharacterized protein n=1 Tax=Suillus luteus UH-Slu-Lm8-n1 TaxID=930992 RepID=A0A0C9ZTE1_9AGAM|nr:hypothetical protein CY34DRAFT_18944 [Suillus luteus UH-Slu-Lm8-n1]